MRIKFPKLFGKKNNNLEVDEKRKVRDIITLEQNTKNIKDLIAIDYLDFSESPKYCLVGEKFAKNMYIGLTPASVEFPTMLDELYTFGDIDVSVYIEPIDSEEAMAELSKLKTNLEVEYGTAGGNTNRRDDMAAKVYEAKAWREEVRDGHNKLYNVCILATKLSDTYRNMENDTSKIRHIMGRKDLGLKNAIYEQEEAYLSNKPIMNNMVNAYNTFDKRSLACTFPYTSANINHENGIPIGRNMDNLLPVIYDNFDSALNNYNMFVCAASGGGKSTFIKMLSARGSTFDDIMNVSIDIEPEYNNIAKTLGGISIYIQQGSDTIINFFDVTTEFVKNKLNGKLMEVVNLDSKINSVTSILLTMAKGFTGSNQEYYTDITRTIIKECVVEIYKEKGITDEVNSLFEYRDNTLSADGSILGGLTKKEMPTLSDWYKMLEKRSKEDKNNTYEKYYDYLLKVMKEYCKYTNGNFTCFDGQSTVELSYDIPFINFDVSALNEETELPLAQHIICDFVWENLVKKNDTGKKIRVIVDEAWRMAKIVNGEPKFPEALSFLDKLFRRARKKNTSAVVITQQFEEFYNELTQSIIRNSDTKVFLPPDTTSVSDIQKVFHLTAGETNFLKRTKRGEALFKCGTEAAKLLIDIPDFELDFVETNQNAMYEEGE